MFQSPDRDSNNDLDLLASPNPILDLDNMIRDQVDNLEASFPAFLRSRIKVENVDEPSDTSGNSDADDEQDDDQDSDTEDNLPPARRVLTDESAGANTVSYTHLTLPTNREV